MQGREGVWDPGNVRVQLLDWNSASDIQAAGGPFRYVLAADCVYNEEHVEALCNVMLALTDLKSTGENSICSSVTHSAVFVGDDLLTRGAIIAQLWLWL